MQLNVMTPGEPNPDDGGKLLPAHSILTLLTNHHSATSPE